MATKNVLVAPAPDCPVASAQLPPHRAKPSRAEIEYRLLTGAPYKLDHQAFTHAVHVALAEAAGKAPLDFTEFHAKGQPCMRASPLTKRYGWAAHYDADGKLALLDPAGPAYAALAADPGQPRDVAMRSKRVRAVAK